MGTFFSRKAIAVAFLCLWVFQLQSGCKRVRFTSGPPPQISAAIDSVRQVYCPDRRLAVFDINTRVRGKNVSITGELDNRDAIAALTSATKNAAKGYKVELDLRLLPENHLGKQVYGLVVSTVANLRAEPRYSAELVSQLLLGTKLKLLKQKDGWFYVQGEDGYLGWLNRAFFKRGDAQMLQDWFGRPLFVYKRRTGTLRKKPDPTSLPVSDLTGGCIVVGLDETKGWLKSELPDGRVGYAAKRYFVDYEAWKTDRAESGKAIAEMALKFNGIPYLWGGTSPKAMDCSGFTQTVYKWNGIQLLRDASQQYRQGKPIDPGRHFKNLLPGDLLFFGPKKDKIIHVGIYLGKRRFIHSSGRVKINSLDPKAADFNEYRYNTFIGARRIILPETPDEPARGGSLAK